MDKRLKQTPAKPVKRSRWVIGVIAGLVLVLGGWKLMHRAPSPRSGADARAKYMATPDFAKLPREQQQAYFDAARGDTAFRQAVEKLSGEQRRQVRGAMASAQMQKTLDEYFALPAGREREAFLLRQIQEREKQQAGRPARPAPPAGPDAAASAAQPGSSRNADPATRIMSRMENVPPSVRAEMGQYFGDLRKLRSRLNLPQPPGRRA